MPVEIPKDKWDGTVRTVTLGATAAEGGTRSHAITVGGQKTLPFMHFEDKTPNRPVVALEIGTAGPTIGRRCCWKHGVMRPTIRRPGRKRPRQPGRTCSSSRSA